MELTKQQQAAAIKATIEACYFLDYEEVEKNINEYISDEGVSFVNGRDKKEYAWYLDSNGAEAAIEVESLTVLTDEEIEDILV